MPRRARATPGGYVYHVLNRSVAGLPLFRKEADCGGLALAVFGHGVRGARSCAILSDWPLERPRDWMRLVNEVMSESDVEKLRGCIARNRPYGGEFWQADVARKLGLSHTLPTKAGPRGK